MTSVDPAFLRGGSDQPAGRLRRVRIVSILLTVLSVAALGLMASTSGRTVTKHTTVTKKIEATAKSTPVPPPIDPAAPAASAAGSGLTLVDAKPLNSAPDPGASAPIVTAAASVTTAPSTAPETTTLPSGAPAAAALPACPLPLPAPAQQGGLQSLIALSPLFGPFSAEAFASAAAFQPLLELFGPFLIAFANAYATAAPALAPLVSQLEALENEGFKVLSPLYGPYRTQFLSAETALATALAPFAQTLATNPAASCVVDIEGVLTSAGSK